MIANKKICCRKTERCFYHITVNQLAPVTNNSACKHHHMHNLMFMFYASMCWTGLLDSKLPLYCPESCHALYSTTRSSRTAESFVVYLPPPPPTLVLLPKSPCMSLLNFVHYFNMSTTLYAPFCAYQLIPTRQKIFHPAKYTAKYSAIYAAK